MKRVFFLSLLISSVACKKSSSSSPSTTNAQIEYEVKTTNASSWSGIYLDATDAATLVQPTSADWTVTFKNQVPSARYLTMQVTSLTPIDINSPVGAIATIYVNGKIVKSDTASGYENQFILPLAQYNLIP